MPDKIKQLNKILTEIDGLFEQDPTKVFFILLLLEQEPVGDEELSTLLSSLFGRFMKHGEKEKIELLIKHVLLLRKENKTNIILQKIIHDKMSDLILKPEVAEYIKHYKSIVSKAGSNRSLS